MENLEDVKKKSKRKENRPAIQQRGPEWAESLGQGQQHAKGGMPFGLIDRDQERSGKLGKQREYLTSHFQLIPFRIVQKPVETGQALLTWLSVA
jgi:hypothetical protein